MLVSHQMAALYATWKGALPPDFRARDEEIAAVFQQQRPWGIETAIDLAECDPDIIRDSVLVGTFAAELSTHLQMRRPDRSRVVRFADDPQGIGYTSIQFIQASDIVAHVIERANGVCLTVLSCLAYPPYATAAFCQEWLGAQRVELSILFRGYWKLDGHEGPSCDE